MKGLNGAFLRYRIMAWITGVVLAALTVWLIVGVDLAFRVRYSVVRTVLILIAGTVPFASFFAEALVHRDLKNRDLLPSS